MNLGGVDGGVGGWGRRRGGWVGSRLLGGEVVWIGEEGCGWLVEGGTGWWG